MASATVIPRSITADKPDRETTAKGYRQYKFINNSRYTVLIAWGWDADVAKFDPDYTIEPYQTHVIQPERPQRHIIWVADTRFPVSTLKQNSSEAFGFVATDNTATVAAINSNALDVLSTPGAALDVNRLIDISDPNIVNSIQLKLLNDAQDRLRIKNDGSVRWGDGNTTPKQAGFVREQPYAISGDYNRLPSYYTLSGLHQEFVITWLNNPPVSGRDFMLYTLYTTDVANGIMQIAIDYVNARMYSRTNISATVWGDWVGGSSTIASGLTPSGAWTTSTTNHVRYYPQQGRVELRGRLTFPSGTALAAGGNVFQIPAAYAPNNAWRVNLFRQDLDVAGIMLNISTAGLATCVNGLSSVASARDYTLDGIFWYVG